MAANIAQFQQQLNAQSVIQQTIYTLLHHSLFMI